MPTDPTPQNCPSGHAATTEAAAVSRQLAPAAARALAEAAERRAARQRDASVSSKESGGRGGLDPVRYGDWEVNGLTSDF
jgi:hypothetical protein